MTVAQALRKKRKITITTSATVSMSVNSISWTEARIVIVRSEVISRVAAGGIVARNSGRMALMFSTVLIMVAPGCRLFAMLSLGLPRLFALVFGRVWNHKSRKDDFWEWYPRTGPCP